MSKKVKNTITDVEDVEVAAPVDEELYILYRVDPPKSPHEKTIAHVPGCAIDEWCSTGKWSTTEPAKIEE